MSFIKKLSQTFKDAADVSTYLADNEVASTRIKICMDCEHLWKVTRQCSKCYCFVDAKTKIRTEKCPLDKW